MEKLTTQLEKPFEVTISEVIHEKLKLLQLKDSDTLIDLGCGDARTLIAAAQLFNVGCVGYEILPKAIEIARKNIEVAGLSDRIKIVEKDFLNADVSKADALILYLTRNSLGKLSMKLENELPKGTRIVTHDFDIPGWKAEKVIDFKSKEAFWFTFYVYCVK